MLGSGRFHELPWITMQTGPSKAGSVGDLYMEAISARGALVGRLDGPYAA